MAAASSFIKAGREHIWQKLHQKMNDLGEGGGEVGGDGGRQRGGGGGGGS